MLTEWQAANGILLEENQSLKLEIEDIRLKTSKEEIQINSESYLTTKPNLCLANVNDNGGHINNGSSHDSLIEVNKLKDQYITKMNRMSSVIQIWNQQVTKKLTQGALHRAWMTWKMNTQLEKMKYVYQIEYEKDLKQRERELHTKYSASKSQNTSQILPGGEDIKAAFMIANSIRSQYRKSSVKKLGSKADTGRVTFLITVKHRISIYLRTTFLF